MNKISFFTLLTRLYFDSSDEELRASILYIFQKIKNNKAETLNI
jgi:hypothetical protein